MSNGVTIMKLVRYGAKVKDARARRSDVGMDVFLVRWPYDALPLSKEARAIHRAARES